MKNSALKFNLVCLACVGLVSLAAFAAEPHADSVVAEILGNVAKLKAVQPNAVPMAFWDFDGTIIKGDVSEGFEENGVQKFKGLMEETIRAGLSTVYKGEDGWKKYRDVDYPRMNAIGRWLAWPYNGQIYEGVEAAKIDAFVTKKFAEVYKGWFFSSSIRMMKALEAAGVENYVVSASPEIFVRNAAEALDLPRSRMCAIKIGIDGGRMTTRLVYPIPFGEGKVENVRQLVLARPNGVAIAGFGNSYSTDGYFLRYIVTQHLPGGAKGFALMINGGKPKPGFEGIFKLVDQSETLAEEAAAASCKDGVCTMPTGATFLTGKCAKAEDQAATGPFFTGDIHDLIDKAGKEGKTVVMSLGRKACPRCLKFYRLVEGGALKFDPAKCVYVKLLVVDLDHKETFLSFCDPDGDNRLPYLGVYNPSSGEASTRAAGGTLEECQAFFKDLLQK